jgi:hypothetical protein
LAEPTLQEIFGAGATQDATTITILKADLPMTALAVNRGEQIIAAMLKKASTGLGATTFGTNIDQSVSIAPGYEQIVYRTVNNNPVAYLKAPLTIDFHKIQATAGITPDDY